MAAGFQSKYPSIKLTTSGENFNAPNNPKNKASKEAISTIKPLEKPLKKPNAKPIAIIMSTIFMSTKVLYF